MQGEHALLLLPALKVGVRPSEPAASEQEVGELATLMAATEEDTKQFDTGRDGKGQA